MIRSLVVLFILSFMLLSKKSHAQDPHFSQFYANPLYLNPALAGSVICPRLIINYRNQWPSILGTYVTYNASFDQHIHALNGAIGILVTTDRAGAGILNTTHASGIYSFRLEVSRNFSINAALQATYFQRSLDWSQLQFPDQFDPKWGPVFNTTEVIPYELNRSFANFSAGFVGSTNRFFFGGAAHNVTRPNEAFISTVRMPIRYTGHAGVTFSIEQSSAKRLTVEESTISPNIMYMQQEDFQQLNIGMYLNKYPFVGGLWFRYAFENPDALIFLIGLKQETFKFGYSFDLTVSRLTSASGGSHEFSIIFQFECPKQTKRIRPISCPTF